MIKFFLKYYLPMLLWAGIIFYFSSVPGLRYSQDTAIEIILRKGAHFLEFGFLSFLFWRILYSGHKLSFFRAFWGALIFSVLFGASDEFHQTFVSSRTGKLADATFDAVSSIFVLNLIVFRVRRKKYGKNILAIFLSAVFLIGLSLWMIEENARPIVSPEEKEIIREEPASFDANTPDLPEIQENEEKLKEESLKNFPSEVMIQVPFTTQAPFALWDELHEEACEEASLIMIKHYMDGTDLSSESAEKEIQALVAYQLEKSGDFKDTNAKETVDLFYNFYGQSVSEVKLSIIYDFKKEDIKKYLSLGKPIIVPAAGRLLNNPNFTPPGPLYHNLVLVGYKGDTIFTNDPGTKRGKNYQYEIDVLFNAIHDFPGAKKDIEKGRKAMIIIEKRLCGIMKK